MELNPGDVVTLQLLKSNSKQDSGIKLKEKVGIHSGQTKFFISKITGLAKIRQMQIQVGDQLLQLNGKPVLEYEGGWKELSSVLRVDLRLALQVKRLDPEAPSSESENSDDSSVDSEPEKEPTTLVLFEEKKPQRDYFNQQQPKRVQRAATGPVRKQRPATGPVKSKKEQEAV
jgi:hypothetical protein